MTPEELESGDIDGCDVALVVVGPVVGVEAVGVRDGPSSLGRGDPSEVGEMEGLETTFVLVGPIVVEGVGDPS